MCAMESPIRPAKPQNTICAVEALIRLIMALKAKTTISGENMMRYMMGEENIAITSAAGSTVVASPAIAAFRSMPTV